MIKEELNVGKLPKAGGPKGRKKEEPGKRKRKHLPTSRRHASRLTNNANPTPFFKKKKKVATLHKEFKKNKKR